MLRGLVISGLLALVPLTALFWAVSSRAAGESALAGALVTLAVMVLGLLGMRLVVAGDLSIAMAGALVVYIGQLILLVAALLVLRKAAWLDGRAFAISASITVVVTQIGLIRGYLRARHPVYPGVAR
ncbi:MAG: hypothetical protein LWW86_13130 [Micrococcales bacterium]|nr:hypothetical protein [Micrococcales bacterium]